MNSGADIDIISLKPQEVALNEKEKRDADEAKHRDEAHAGFLNELNSPTSRTLLSIIEKRLANRIDELTQQDPESLAYIKLLHDIGEKTVLGRNAAQRIMKYYLRREQE